MPLNAPLGVAVRAHLAGVAFPPFNGKDSVEFQLEETLQKPAVPLPLTFSAASQKITSWLWISASTAPVS